MSSEKDRLKQFYFSTSSSFGAFKSMEDRRSKRRAESPQQSQPPQSQSQQEHGTSLSAIDVSMPSTINDEAGQEQEARPVPRSTVPTELRATGGAVNAVRATASKKSTGAELPSAASPGYYHFLKQQQELQKAHNRLESATEGLANERRTKMAELVKLRRESRELLREIEESSNWSLHSKYDVQQLIRDSTLSLQPVELVDDKQPQLAALQQLGRQLEQLKAARQQTMQFAPHALLVDQGLRRLSLLEKTLGDGNMDFTTVSRIPDTLLVQLTNVCDLSTVDALIAKFEEAIDLSTFQTEEARKRRETAVADGEVHIAEKMCYDILKHHEDMLGQIIAKIHVFEDALKENTVLAQVNEQYLSKATEEFDRLRVRMGKLRARCEADLAKMFSLRSKVEEVEAQTVKKVQEERDRSDSLLQKNAERLDAVFVKLEELEREAEMLERERHQLFQKRLQEKEKDEHRKTEYSQFCAVVDAHTKPLERTIRNVDLMNHSADILQEFVSNGFTSVRDDLKERGKLLRDVKLETHKQHVEAMRGLMVELGDVVYRKERMIEETDKNIQQAHVQQELLAETFNPNAKKFGTVKKRLLLNRDELESDVQELKKRAEDALQHFVLSEEALSEADVPYVHPVTEQQHHALALRTKMMEFKAVIAGQTHNQPMLQELEALKAEVADSQAELDAVNASTSGTMNKSLPMIRAAMKSRSPQRAPSRVPQ